MLYLSSLAFRNEYLARHIFKNTHHQHQLVMSLFEDRGTSQTRSDFKVLWRRESRSGNSGFLIQSTVEPDLSWVKNEAMRSNLTLRTRPLDDVLEDFLSRELISYKIMTNPIRRQGNRRIPIRGRENILSWWQEKAVKIGLTLADNQTIVDVNNTEQVKKPSGHELVLNSSTIVGRALVDDPGLLRIAVENGIGHGKPYGFGLLSLAGVGHN